MIRIAFIERRYWGFVSIEKIFAQIGKTLGDAGHKAVFQKVVFDNSLLGIIRNLLSFRRPGADIYHITGHIHYMALVLPPERTVLTIHDLGFLHIRTGIRRWLIKKLFLDWPLRRLRYVTAISERTRDEILENTNIPRDRIRVIENPLQEQYLSGRARTFRTQEPTLLQIGTLPNKNLPSVARAIKGIKCRLRIVGRLDADQEQILKDNEINYHNDPELGDEEMLSAYDDADMVVFCSTYEGFGMPVIEAQSMRRLVITSGISPLQEVAGDGAIFVDPADPSSIRAAIMQAIDDRELRNSVIEKGALNAVRFAPEKIADQYLTLYREMLDNLL